ncbi:MAG: ASKHA domain-containing protein [Treponema sp.]|jgi:uncharacterized 2Fe-2S/4Fe-4S cluster protein (DUF4445 family)|nr:ASKHA domain-containing protein [Treponema sp.]
MPKVFFINENKSISVEEGATILEAARLAGVRIESPCGAIGSCGKCGVRVSPPPRDKAACRYNHTLSRADQKNGYVLACQYPAGGDIEVQVKDYAGENRGLRILTAGGNFIYEKQPFISKQFRGGRTEILGGGKVLGTETGDTSAECYGLAVDIGTTTIVTALVDLRTGRTLASESALNPQAAYAQDVLGRIRFASSKEGGLKTLTRAFLDALETMIASLTAAHGVKRDRIYEAVYSGNTAMLHLACGVDPVSLGQFPYTPKLFGGSHVSAEALGIAPFGLIWLPPIICAYVGADISSGILASGLAEKKGAVLFIDIGTNGEMVLARDGLLAAASTAAGPAFEGMNISCGMRASRGAIESFRVDRDGCFWEVIGAEDAASPAGICGSGLLDITGELVRTGVIEKSGRFVPPEEGAYRKSLAARMGRQDGKPAFFITPEVYLTQQDIRQIQLAKGAIRCGIQMLLSRFGMKAGDVDSVEIAGGFGCRLRESTLINIGLLPRGFAGKAVFVGNSSLTGGIAFLMNAGFRPKMIELVKRVDKVELANDKNFEETFIKYLSF